jgi:hypothetical protein
LRRVFFLAESRTSRLSVNLTDVGGRDGCGCGAVSRTLRRELRVESSRRRCWSPWASPSPRARPCALGEERLHREMEIWLSPKLPALGEDSVSGSGPVFEPLNAKRRRRPGGGTTIERRSRPALLGGEIDARLFVPRQAQYSERAAELRGDQERRSRMCGDRGSNEAPAGGRRGKRE